MVKSLWSNNITDMSCDRKFPRFYSSVITSGQKEEKKKQAKKKKKRHLLYSSSILVFLLISFGSFRRKYENWLKSLKDCSLSLNQGTFNSRFTAGENSFTSLCFQCKNCPLQK